MEHPIIKLKYALLLTAAAIALSACSNDKSETDPAATPPAANQPSVESPTTEQPDSANQPAAEGQTAEEPVPHELAETKELQVTVEGQTETVIGTLTRSALGYAFYLLENFEFTPEEPGKDIVFHKQFGDFFLRIEPLPSDSNREALRNAAEQAMKAVDDNVVDRKDSFFDEAIRSRADFILQASGPEGSATMIVMPIGDKRFRFTLNSPMSEASEGITPRFYPMIRSIVVTE
jgi:hypothetical protein